MTASSQAAAPGRFALWERFGRVDPRYLIAFLITLVLLVAQLRYHIVGGYERLAVALLDAVGVPVEAALAGIRSAVVIGVGNVALDVGRVLAAAMPNQMRPLSGPLLLNAGDSYTISFAGVKPGRYDFFCLPHVGMQMKGTVVVR